MNSGTKKDQLLSMSKKQIQGKLLWCEHECPHKKWHPYMKKALAQHDTHKLRHHTVKSDLIQQNTVIDCM